MAYHIFAVIRVGSLEQELSVYEIGANKEFRRIDRLVNRFPLGSETFEHGKISYSCLEELIEVLKGFQETMKAYRVNSYRAYATAAFREARNVKLVTDRIRVRTGINIEVVSNSEQRFINYKALAVKTDIDFNEIIKEGTAIIDSGYGGMQISLFDKDRLISTENLPIAFVKLAETVGELNAARSAMLEEIKELSDIELMNYRRLYLKNRAISNLIVFGESTSLLFRRKNKGNGRVINYSAEEALNICDELLALGNEKIEERYSVNRSFADVLTVTAVVYKRIIEMTGAANIILTGSGFCDGAAADYAEKNKLIRLKHDFEEDIVASSANIAKKYKCDRGHSRLVEEYSLTIFDAVRKIGGLSKRDRLLLRIAAMLHTCGKFISIRNAAECGSNIIRSTEIIGLSHGERELIANIVKYNTAEFDYELTENDSELIRAAKLTAILRIGNALDRGHNDKIETLKASTNDREGTLLINASSRSELSLEKREVMRKAGFFKEIFGLSLVFKQKKLL